MVKSFFSILMVVILAVGVFHAKSISLKAASEVKFTTSAEVCNYLFQGYNQGKKGPIIITKGTFQKWLVKKEVYLVTLTRTEFVWNQTTGYMTDILAGFNLKNLYLLNAVKAIKRNIPADSNVILAGHSLGGMIAQQLAAEPSLKKDYLSEYTLLSEYGSSSIWTKLRIRRFWNGLFKSPCRKLLFRRYMEKV